VERRPLDSCPNCGGELVESVERRERIVAGFRTRRAAQEALNSAITALRGDADVAPSKVTVRQYLVDEWLPSLSATLRPSTVATYRSVVETNVLPTLGAVALQKLNATQIEALYAILMSRPRSSCAGASPLSAGTVRLVHVVLHRALKDAVRKGWRMS
jgi:ABC-type phosphate/phosphonate transport system substrate-binding protein